MDIFNRLRHLIKEEEKFNEQEYYILEKYDEDVAEEIREGKEGQIKKTMDFVTKEDMVIELIKLRERIEELENKQMLQDMKLMDLYLE